MSHAKAERTILYTVAAGLLVVALAILITGLTLVFKEVNVLEGYQIHTTAGATYHLGESVPYTVDANKVDNIQGVVERFFVCKDSSGRSVPILEESTPTVGSPGKEHISSSIGTLKLENSAILKPPFTCQIKTVIAYKPNPLHTTIYEGGMTPESFTIVQ